MKQRRGKGEPRQEEVSAKLQLSLIRWGAQECKLNLRASPSSLEAKQVSFYTPVPVLPERCRDVFCLLAPSALWACRQSGRGAWEQTAKAATGAAARSQSSQKPESIHTDPSGDSEWSSDHANLQKTWEIHLK